MANQPLAFAELLAGSVLVISAITDRSIAETIQGVTEPAPGSSSILKGGSSSSTANASESAPTIAQGGVANSAGGFLAGKLLEYSRHDQGRDIRTEPGAAIIAPGAGEVVRIASDPKGFGPDYPIVKFTTGPYAGKTMYIGHVDAAIRKGRFKKGQILAHTSRTGHNAPPGWAEIGYAPGGSPGPFGQPAPF